MRRPDNRRAPESLRQFFHIDAEPFRHRHVEHRQCNGYRHTEFSNLLHEIQTLVQVRRIDDRENAVGRPRTFQAPENDIDRDLLLKGVRAERVRAGKVNELDATIIELGDADVPLNGYAWVVTNALVQSRQSIEQRALTAIRISDHRDAGIGLPTNRDLVDRDPGFRGASHRLRQLQP